MGGGRDVTLYSRKRGRGGENRTFLCRAFELGLRASRNLVECFERKRGWRRV